jgi:hypothetical protein
MLIYFVPLSVSFLFGVFRGTLGQKYLRQFEYVFIALCGVFYCSGYMTGSDWRSYEVLYGELDWSYISKIPIEKGFYAYAALFKSLSIQFWSFLIFSKLITFVSIVAWIKRHVDNLYFAMLLFFGFNVLFLFVDNPLRFMLALGIVANSYDSLLNRRFFRFCIIILFATLFHVSSLFMLVVYFVLEMKDVSKKKALIAYCLVVALFSPTMLLGIANLFVNAFPLGVVSIKFYLNKGLNASFSIVSISTIYYFLLFCLLLRGRRLVLSIPNYGSAIYKLSVAWFFVLRITSVLPTFFRISIFLAPFAIIAIVAVVTKSKKKIMLATLIFLYIILSNYKNINNSWTYYPYTNYFISRSLSEKTYEYRSEYNKSIFERRFGIDPDQAN